MRNNPEIDDEIRARYPSASPGGSPMAGPVESVIPGREMSADERRAAREKIAPSPRDEGDEAGGSLAEPVRVAIRFMWRWNQFTMADRLSEHVAALEASLRAAEHAIETVYIPTEEQNKRRRAAQERAEMLDCKLAETQRKLGEVERERNELRCQLEKAIDGRPDAWMARALDAERNIEEAVAKAVADERARCIYLLNTFGIRPIWEVIDDINSGKEIPK